MPAHDGPPIMINRGFLEQKENILKLIEIGLGIVTAFMNSFCYPNNIFLYCSGKIFSTVQLFQFMVINIFCVIMTLLITLANVLGFYDAYYRYNLPILERYLVTLFAILYTGASIASIIELLTTQFMFVFMLPTLFTVWTTAAYLTDAYRQWQNREKHDRW